MNEKNWSIHVEFLVIFFTLLGGYFMIQQDISAQTSRIDQVNTRTDQVNTRIDQLYTMFIDLLKEGKK